MNRLIQLSITILVAALLTVATPARADEYDTLRASRLNTLLASASSVTSVANRANLYWLGNGTTQVAMNTTPSVATPYLWSDLTFGSNAGNISSTYKRLQAMALAWAQPGNSLNGNASLATAISNGLDWMNANVYKATGGQYENWYDWEVTAPQALDDTMVLFYPALTTTQIANNCDAIDNYGPTSANATPYFTWNALTGANTVDVVLVTAIRGILGKNSTKLTDAKVNLSKVFPFATSGDGFHADGSFVFHANIAYTGHYGITQLEGVATIVNLLQGSTWAITDPELANVYDWITNGFEPLIYNGAMMDMVRGRAASWSSSTEYDKGAEAIEAIRQIALFAPPATAAALTAFADSPRLASGQFHFAGMDRVVALRSGFGFGLSMSSSRIANFENLFSTSNLKGWFTGDGMTYLYVGATDTQFTDTFWPTVDYYHLPGTTVEQGYVPQPSTTDQSWVGGAQVAGTYGAAGMSLHPAASPTASSTLNGKKSWFMLDNKIVCLGAGIACTTGNAVDTTVENRRLGAAPTSNLTVNGVQYPPTAGWSASLSGSTWCSLDGVGGYYFPSSTSSLSASFVARSGSWTQIRPDDSDTTVYSENYLKLWFNHGVAPSNASYAYVLLPGMNASGTSAYAQNPDVTVVANTTNIQAVKSVDLGVVGANFWATGGGTADWITVNKRASVVTLETYNGITVGISDPTQSITTPVPVTLNRAALSTVAADAGITVTQLTPNIVFTVNVNAAKGKTFQVSFAQAAQPPVITSLGTAGGNQGTTFSYQITASNAPASYGANGLPAGLSVDPVTGIISGTPAQTGTFNATFSATNPGGTGSATLSLTILPPAPAITSVLSLIGINGRALAYQITATNNPVSYGASGLPAGLSVNPATGVITGTPGGMTIPTNVTITATNSGGTTSATLVITDATASFPATGTWICPANVTAIQIECWGGGGAGGSAQRTGGAGSVQYGGGGAGGAYAKANAHAVVPGATYYINVGAGGVNTSSTTGTTVAGGDSWFNGIDSASSSIIAKGGAGGASAIGNTSTTRYGAGGAGTATASVGDVVYAGGSGAVGSAGGAGGGGSSAGTSSIGTTTTTNLGATAPAGGGSGGTGTVTGSVSGAAGTAPGGGGGGSRDSSNVVIAGGAGGAGKVVLTVGKTASIITLGNLAHHYDGSAKSATAITNPTITGTISFTYNGSSTTPSAAGSYTVVASINDTNYSGTATGTLVIAEAVTAWRQLFFLTTANTGAAADSADPDGDGWSNAEEYLFGTFPTTPGSTSLLGTSSSGNDITLTFIARQATGTGYTGLVRHYALEFTTDVSNAASWAPLAGYSDILGAGQTVTITQPASGPNKFYKLKAWLE